MPEKGPNEAERLGTLEQRGKDAPNEVKCIKQASIWSRTRQDGQKRKNNNHHLLIDIFNLGAASSQAEEWKLALHPDWTPGRRVEQEICRETAGNMGWRFTHILLHHTQKEKKKGKEKKQEEKKAVFGKET
ncbi:hypothetical protein MGYG_08235 [Nannizzia gypsea CBS 118893]|uniref:Uncharacterized protein n=1 Tax=Arthroderma gypseum (strain ATCC MYA-4604 / CBS 118893) TaxID=535722 RepID=E4V639_ARTGP|nr:hypothetical protein MGYG_08235 [Nannizzia gypsea CBS 118893]EFR05222.1 hypothetical protein MGYG_08235 [Nannizzia gypsea CBS 118893]